MRKSRGKATITKNGDVTTIRVVDYHGQPPPEQKPINKSISININQDDLISLKHTDIIAFAKAAEQAFISILDQLLDEMPDGVPVTGLRAETAFVLGVSTETAKRYIEKYCYSFSSPYRINSDGRVIRKNTINTHKSNTHI